MIIKKISLVFFFFAKRFVALFPKKYDDEIVKEIVTSLEKNSFYHYKNFYTQSQISELRAILNELEEKSQQEGNSVNKNLTNKKVRTNILKYNSEVIQNYTQNKIIMDVAEKFHGIKCNVTKASFEVKERGDNPESGELKDRKDDTIFYHFDRPFKVLKTFLIFEDIEDKDGPLQIVKGSHKLMYKSPLRKLFKFFGKIFINDTDYLLALEDEKFFINDNDVVSCKGKVGDLFFINTEAWHCGRRVSVSGKRVQLWNYIYADHLSSWLKHLVYFKFLRR
jgi:ectoine hydroxylase-related dioxygenase (phytanoyl-CoA dioxygenase family)